MEASNQKGKTPLHAACGVYDFSCAQVSFSLLSCHCGSQLTIHCILAFSLCMFSWNMDDVELPFKTEANIVAHIEAIHEKRFYVWHLLTLIFCVFGLNLLPLWSVLYKLNKYNPCL